MADELKRFHVTADPQDHVFQWVQAETEELAMSQALANPNAWTRSNLRGIGYNLTAREVPEPMFGIPHVQLDPHG